MKLPSIQYLYQHTIDTLRRHPMVILSASFAVFFAIFLVERENSLEDKLPFINLMLCGYLGVPLFLAWDVFSVATNRSSKQRLLGISIGVLVIIGVYFFLPNSEDTLNISIPYMRYAILAVAAHLLVSFAPFIRSGTLNGFWQFNKTLFLRFFLSVLYSGFLYIGLVLALLALKQLFKIDIPDELFFEMFITIAGMFNTWFFCTGIPQDYNQLDGEIEYPKGLRIFILYVLIPLLALYFLILYSYSAKILLEWNWPSGIITYMIIAVAVLGILASLLAYPYSKTESKNPISFLSKGYYWVLIPMIFMLFVAIGIRVFDYGITINRYLTILLAIWLLGVSIYSVLKGRDIRIIPMSLFTIILLCSVGPWSMFNVAESSQVSRLEAILNNAGILDGKIINEPELVASSDSTSELSNLYKNEGILSDSLHNEVMSIVYYLDDFHGLNALNKWFEQDLRTITEEIDSYEGTVAVQLMGLKYGRKYSNNSNIQFPNFYAENSNDKLTMVSGYEYIYEFDYYYYEDVPKLETVELDNEQVMIIQFSQNTISIKLNDENASLTYELLPLYESLVNRYSNKELRPTNVPSKEMQFFDESPSFKTDLRLTNIYANEDGIISYRGMILFAITEE